MVNALAGNPQRVLDLHGMRIAEHEALHFLCDDDGVFTIGRVVHVVRILDVYGFPFLPCRWIDLRQAVALVIEYPQRRQIIGRGYMLGKPPHAKCFDDFVARGIDYGDGVAFGVGNVHSIWKVSHSRSQVSGPVRRIDVVGIENRRHTWKRTNPLCRCFLCEEAHEQGNL